MRKAAAAIVVSLVVLLPGTASGQEEDDESSLQAQPQVVDALGDFSLVSVSPNPFESETRITFRLGEGLLGEDDEVRVTMRVFNILHQVVAVPALLGEDDRAGEPIDDLPFDRPGLYEAHWSGVDMDGNTATPGPYFVELRVGERSRVRKILLLR